MKKLSYICCALIVTSTLSARFVAAQDKAEPPKVDAKMEEMMKRYAIAMTPGDAHKGLEMFVGEWTCEVKNWQSPDAPPETSKATAKAAWVMNGRFVQEDFSGEMGGKPFKGMNLFGYDTLKQKYTSMWVDDMNTAMFASEGISTDGGKTIVFMGKMECPTTGEHDRPLMITLRIVSADRHIMEMGDPRHGEKGRMMEITYTRKK